MARTVMRNRVTGEYREVEADSTDFYNLRRQLYDGDGRPLWEQTGQHDLEARKAREESGVLRPEDLGDKDQPFEKTFGDPLAGHAPQLDRGIPTPGEIAQGAGRAANLSPDELASAQAALHEPHTEGYPGGGLKRVGADGSDSEVGDVSIGSSGVPVTSETPSVLGDLNNDGDLDDPYEGWSKGKFEEENKTRQIEIVRTDGRTDLPPRLEDYLAAFTAADKDESESESEEVDLTEEQLKDAEYLEENVEIEGLREMARSRKLSDEGDSEDLALRIAEFENSDEE